MTTSSTILLVEDDPDQRSTLAEILVRHGYAVTAVDSAEAALDLLETHRFDLLISDYRLGGATGSWLAKVALRHGQLTAPQVLIVTGHDVIADGEGLSIVKKPFEAKVFMAKVAQALSAGPELEEVTGPDQRIAFVMYINDSQRSVRAVKALKAILAGYQESQIALTLVDLTTGAAHQAELDRVTVTPTLVKTFPAPRTWIVGELEAHEPVTRLLEQAGVQRRE